MKKEKHIYQLIADNLKSPETKKISKVDILSGHGLIFFIEVVSSKPIEFMREKQYDNN